MNLRGYDYWKQPKEIKYRYPAPGSVPQRPQDRPHLYKHDWRTPFTESPFDVRTIDKVELLQERAEHFYPKATTQPKEGNPADSEWIKYPDSAMDEGKYKESEWTSMNAEEKQQSMWAAFESHAQDMKDYDESHCTAAMDVYNQRVDFFEERGFHGQQHMRAFQ